MSYNSNCNDKIFVHLTPTVKNNNSRQHVMFPSESLCKEMVKATL